MKIVPKNDSHSIQEATALGSIERNGHVYMFPTDIWPHAREGYADPKLIGIHQASTFRGFCPRHDDLLFAPLEKKPYVCSPEQNFLLSYRALCKEIYTRKRVSQIIPCPSELKNLDTEFSYRSLKDLIGWWKAEDQSARRGLASLKLAYDTILLSQDYSFVDHFIIRFRNPPTLTCTSIVNPEYDFLGRHLQTVTDIKWRHDHMTVCSMPYLTGGVFVFSWPSSYSKTPVEFCNSFTLQPDSEKTDAIVRLAFEHFENLAWSPEWWESLPPSTQDHLVARFQSGAPPSERLPNCLLPDGIKYDDWGFETADYLTA